MPKINKYKMKILKVEKSDKPGKKLVAKISDGTKIDFGSAVSQTYTEGATKQKRENYLKRHLAVDEERRLIKNKIISPALLSVELLWGESRSLKKNIKALNDKL
jgi:hypothetical protein